MSAETLLRYTLAAETPCPERGAYEGSPVMGEHYMKCSECGEVAREEPWVVQHGTVSPAWVPPLVRALATLCACMTHMSSGVVGVLAYDRGQYSDYGPCTSCGGSFVEGTRHFNSPQDVPEENRGTGYVLRKTPKDDAPLVERQEYCALFVYVHWAIPGYHYDMLEAIRDASPQATLDAVALAVAT